MNVRRLARMAAALLALAALAAGVAACGSSSGGSGTGGSSPGAAAGSPVKGGTLTMTFQGEPTGLDPAIAWENESMTIEMMCYRTFLQYNPAPGVAGTKLIPDMATEVPTAANGGISADGKTYVFHIRPGIKFAPPINRAVTAADFKYSFERMMKEPLAPATFFYTGVVGADAFQKGKAAHISGYKVVDPQTVQITLMKPDMSFLYAMTMAFTSVVPKEQVAKYGKQFNRHPLGTGPFVFDHWTPGQEIVMHRNPNYYNPALPYVDTVHYIFSANPSTALLKLERGEVDVLGDSIPAADYARTKADPKWGKYVVDAPQIAWFYVFMNVLEKPFDNKLVRQAVNYAVDPAHVQKILAAQGRTINQIYPVGMPGHQDGKTYYTRDVAKAKQLLAQAGFPNGFTTTFYTHNVDPFPRLSQALQADLGEAGIKVQIKQMDRATYWTTISLKKSHVGIGLSDWYMDFPDPSDWVGPLFTNPADGSSNSSFYENPQVTPLFNASASQLDPAKRLAMFQQMQDIIMADAPTAPLYQPIWNAMYGTNVGGFYMQPVNIFDPTRYWKLNGQ
jgi:oligopeptide transport system substrate-binding protein